VNLLCAIFGHKSLPEKWVNSFPYPGGDTYLEIGKERYEDGVGRIHTGLYARCPRCDMRRRYYMTHLPTTPTQGEP